MNAPSPGPRLSIITPCLNGARYVGDAIESVLRQDLPDVEHIVADGGSTDGTLDILKQYAHLRVLSSPDHGVYDALNKGLAVARGEVIGLLNSDDCYGEDVFLPAIEGFRDATVMAVAGAAVAIEVGGGVEAAGGVEGAGRVEAAGGVEDAGGVELVGGGGGLAGGIVRRLTPEVIDVLFQSTLGNPCINAWFFRSSVFRKIGPFDASYRIAGDRELMLRFACSGLRYSQIDKVVCRYRVHAGSMTFGGSEAVSDAVAREHTRMTEVYLRKPELSQQARELIRRAHTRDTLHAAMRSARQHHLGRLLRQAAAGTRHDIVWPARFAKGWIRGPR